MPLQPTPRATLLLSRGASWTLEILTGHSASRAVRSTPIPRDASRPTAAEDAVSVRYLARACASERVGMAEGLRCPRPAARDASSEPLLSLMLSLRAL